MSRGPAGENVPYPVSAVVLVAGAVIFGVTSHGWLAEPSPSLADAPAPAVTIPPPPIAPPPALRVEATDEPVAPPPMPEVCAPLMFQFAAGAERAWTGPAEGSIADLVRRAQSARVMIIGHADTTGSPAANLRLSHRRANRVADFLVLRGLERSRITVRALGEFAPLDSSPAMEANNRRVEVHLRGADECPTTAL
ncbi:MAG: OmpA family protein [Sandaracinaceae bacterium]